VRLAHLLDRLAGRPLALRPRAPRSRDPAALLVRHGARRVWHHGGDHREPRQGEPGPPPPTRRGVREHGPHRGRHQGDRRGRDMTLRVGVSAVPHGASGAELVRQAERLGADSVWVPEFWGGDAFTPLAYLAAQTSTIRLGTAIAQLGARTPAMLAMTAMTLQALSDNRFVLGIGSSGPQVMEGWHGVPFDRPLRRTRETI